MSITGGNRIPPRSRVRSYEAPLRGRATTAMGDKPTKKKPSKRLRKGRGIDW